MLNFIDLCTGSLQDGLSRGTVRASSGWDKLLGELDERRQKVSGVYRSNKGPAPRAPPEGAPAQPNLDSEPASRNSDESHYSARDVSNVLQVIQKLI